MILEGVQVASNVIGLQWMWIDIRGRTCAHLLRGPAAQHFGIMEALLGIALEAGLGVSTQEWIILHSRV